jgi:hypothetical protein
MSAGGGGGRLNVQSKSFKNCSVLSIRTPDTLNAESVLAAVILTKARVWDYPITETECDNESK